MSLIRKLGFAYFALFVIVAAMSYVPHLAIGGFAAYVGFVLSNRHGETA